MYTVACVLIHITYTGQINVNYKEREEKKTGAEAWWLKYLLCHQSW